MRNVYVKTLGCKVNTFDSHALASRFADRGYHLVNDAKDADVTVINSCSVTANAEKDARYLLRRYRRENPASKLVITGCYAQTDSARLVEMPEVDFVVPNATKHQLVDLVEELFVATPGTKISDTERPVRDNKQSHFKSSVTLFDKAMSEQTRAFVKIQDGCNNFCAYCLIPYARGQSRSVPAADVIAEVKRLIALKTPEIVLTGIHLGDYGREHQQHADSPFIDLLTELLRLPGIPPLRISSLEPSELSEPLLQLMARHRPHFRNHLHLPLQAGHDRTLKRMRREYTTTEYAACVEMARAYLPGVNIGADVIPGFPGESDEEFAATVAYIKDLRLGYLHVFPYSSRPNTAAARMPEHLSVEIVKQRAQELRALSLELATDYAAGFLGKTLNVLWESHTDDQGRNIGRTSEYLEVVAPSDSKMRAGDITSMRIKGFVEERRLFGVPQTTLTESQCAEST